VQALMRQTYHLEALVSYKGARGDS